MQSSNVVNDELRENWRWTLQKVTHIMLILWFLENLK